MPLPELTPEQRSAAAASAIAARAARADICAQLKAGEISIAEVLDRAAEEQALAKLRVLSLLRSLPGIGEAKSDAVMERLQIARSRRLRGLGPNQRAALRREFGAG